MKNFLILIIFINFSVSKIASEETCPYFTGCMFFSKYITKLFYKYQYAYLECKPGKPFNFNLIDLNKSDKNACGLRAAREFTVQLENFYFDASISPIMETLMYTDAYVTRIYIIRAKLINAQTPPKIPDSYHESIDLNIFDSKFRFVDSHGENIRSCKDFERINSSNSHFLDWNVNLGSNFFRIIFKNVDYNKPICELVFKNTRLKWVEMGKVFETFFKTNLLRFIPQTSIKELNISISYLRLNSYEIDLDSRVLNSKIYRLNFG